eukprot:3084451-Amphidinium_carterae.1
MGVMPCAADAKVCASCTRPCMGESTFKWLRARKKEVQRCGATVNLKRVQGVTLRPCCMGDVSAAEHV